MTGYVLMVDRIVIAVRERLALALAPWLRPPRVIGIALHDAAAGEEVRVLTSNGGTRTLYARDEAA